MTVEVKGLSDLQQFLDEFPAKFQINAMRGAVSAAARVVAKEAKQRCPVGQPSTENKRIYGGYEGALRDSIRVSSRIDRASGTVVSKAVAGGKNKKGADVYYAHMVEATGAVAHHEAVATAHALYFNGVFRMGLEHPGFKAEPFMRPALDARMGEAVVAAGEHVKTRLTKQGLDTAGVIVEEV